MTLLCEVVCEPFLVGVVIGSCGGADGEVPEEEGGAGAGGVVGGVGRV